MSSFSFKLTELTGLTYLHILIIVCIVLVVLCIAYATYTYFQSRFDGFYVASEEFLTISGLDSLVFYFSTDKVYIIMSINDNLVINDMYEYSISGSNLTIKSKDGTEFINAGIPCKLKITSELKDNKLTFEGDDDKKYAILYKNYELSDDPNPNNPSE